MFKAKKYKKLMFKVFILMCFLKKTPMFKFRQNCLNFLVTWQFGQFHIIEVSGLSLWFVNIYARLSSFAFSKSTSHSSSYFSTNHIGIIQRAQ